MAYMPTAQQTPWQQGDEFDPKKTAVLVIDVLGGNTGLPQGFEAQAENCISIVKAAREKEMPVIFACDAHIAAYDREVQLWGEHGIAGTQGAKPLDEFGLSDTDIVIPKRRYDAFFQTDLDLTLRELGIDALIAVGADANICVLQTLAGAYFRGYRSIVPHDAVWTFLVGTQEGALEYYSACYNTRIVDTDHVLGSYLS